jgi:hypothetical protein
VSIRQGHRLIDDHAACRIRICPDQEIEADRRIRVGPWLEVLRTRGEFDARELMENRHGLCVDLKITAAVDAETEAAKAMLERQWRKRVRPGTLGADKGYHSKDFVAHLRQRRMHIAMIDGRTTRHTGYAVSQRKRKRVEEIFGWMKA